MASVGGKSGINLTGFYRPSPSVIDTGQVSNNDDSTDPMETDISNLDEVSLDDLMDVVTSYKCKFCQFTCLNPEGISSHVRSVHMDVVRASRHHKAEEQDHQQEQQQLVTIIQEEAEVNKVERVVVTADQLPELQQVLQIGEGAQLIVQDDKGEEITLEVAPDQDSSTIVERAFHVSTTIEEEDGGTALLVSAAEVKNDLEDLGHDTLPEDVQMTDVTSQTPAVRDENNECTEEQLIQEEACQVQSGAERQYEVPGEIDESHMFVCGQCNLGFTNIDECKQHMVKDHNITMEAMECLDEQVEKEINGEPNKVSVATQVVPAKRPGRKPKKVEPVVVVVSDEDIDDDEDEEESENIQVRRNDSDGEDGDYGKGKRRIRPPKSLTDIYYMGKKKPPVIKKRRPSKVQVYDLKCGVSGCTARFKTAEVLLLHVQCHIDPKERKLLRNKTKDGQDAIFRCPHCTQKFKLWKQVRMHLWKDHHINTDLLTCDKCDFRSDSILKMEMHQEIHSADRSHICQICEKGFKQAAQLRNHRINVHRKDDLKSQEPVVHSCQICKREFATAKYLHNHLQQVHATVKPFMCPYCTHATARKAMMELHIRTHTGEKPYKCDMCNYASGDHNSLRRHKMRHTGRKPYKCQHCPYSCIQAISLKTHMKNKHPGRSEGIYMCDQCQYRTVNKQNYDNHLEDHKNGLVFQGQDVDDDQAGGRRRPPVPKQIKQKPQTYTATTMGSVNSIDLSKVSGIEGLAPSDLNAAQLIYSALNAMSQQQTPEDQVHANQAVSGASVQVSQASSISSTTQDGITTHTITLHLPQPSGAPAEVPVSNEGTSSAAVDINNPVVLTVNPGTRQAISLLNGHTEPSAAAGEVQFSSDNSQQHQVTDIVQQAIQGLEVLQQGDVGQGQVLQTSSQTQILQGMEVIQPSQVLQTISGLQHFEGVQVFQPQLSTISVDGQTLQIQGQNIIASDTGQVLFKSQPEGSETLQDANQQSQ